jgi:CRISPR system Cascade subunit CasA
MTVHSRGWGRRSFGQAASLLAVLALCACARYTPAPPHPERFEPAFEARAPEAAPTDHVWTGADLLAEAARRNPAILEAAAKYRASFAAARASRVPPAIGLTLTAEWAHEHPTWGHGAAADIPLDAGAARSTRVSTADLQALQAHYDLQEAIWTVRNDLAQARGELVGAQAEVSLAEQAAALRAERVRRLEARVAAGEDDRPVLLVARRDEVAAERRAADARARRDAAQVALARALGLPTSAVAQMTLAPPGEAPPMAGLAVWRRDALGSRSDVLRAVADYDIAENALRLEVARQRPEVRLQPAYNWDHGVLKLPFGLALALPPQDLNRAAIRQAEAARAAAGASLEAVQANVFTEVDRAAAARAAAQANLAHVRDQDLPAAKRLAAAAQRQLAAGQADRVEELAARAAAAEAELDLVDAERAARGATADLEHALRRAFDPAEAAVLQSQMEMK